MNAEGVVCRVDSGKVGIEMDSAQMSPVAPVAQVEKKRGISGSTIKIIAIVTMLIDHIAAVILTRQMVATGYLEALNSGVYENLMGWLTDNLGLYYAYDVMRMVGRIGFPIFCFLLVEGFCHTANVKMYLARLGIFALITEVPFDLAITGSFFDLRHQNVFFTLFLGLFTLCAYEYFGKTELKKAWRWVVNGTGALLPAAYITICLANLAGVKDAVTLVIACGILCAAIGIGLVFYGKSKGSHKLQILCADVTVLMLVMYLADLLYTDYSGMGVLTIVVMYLFRKNKISSMAAGCVVLTVMSLSEITAFFALIPIALYNGKRGMKVKYFFYVFYPLHLLVLYLISLWMGLGGLSLM